MKKIMIVAVCLLGILTLPAQGIYQLWGMTSGGGADGLGTIFSTDATGNNFHSMHQLVNIADGKFPVGNLVQYGEKLYGLTEDGGINGGGVIFEYDLVSNVYTRKIAFDFNDINGSSPGGNLTLFGGKFYGMSHAGGSAGLGVIFEWDPATNVYTKKIDFDGITTPGRPSGVARFTLANGKLYAVTTAGQGPEEGVIFEWDPVTNVLTKKVTFSDVNGGYPAGNLTQSGNKLYGLTSGGGTNGGGVIFEWDPATNVYTKMFDFPDFGQVGAGPHGDLTLREGKFYGFTESGGNNNTGVIFEWDPVTNVYTKKFDFGGTNGDFPQRSLTLSEGRFFGMTGFGGNNNLGVIFEWCSHCNVYTKKKDFNGMDGANPIANNLTLVQVPAANGLRGSCVSFPTVTIDNSNNNKWVSITDDNGNAVAEIKANGNNLGIINASMFVNNNSVREDGTKKLYLDRNVTLTPQVQPTSPVDIRVYIKSSEYQALKNAVNSMGEPSGIISINDLGIFKVENNSCSSALESFANPVATTVAPWLEDYVLSATISSFSSFYFANKAFVVLPLTLLEFNGRLINKSGVLTWKTTNEQNTAHFEMERSTDGSNYTVVGTVASTNTAGIHSYSFIDPNITSLSTAVVYYRLKQRDYSGRFTSSRIVALSINNSNIILFYPNPVKDKASLTITIRQQEQVKARVIDASGKVVNQQQWTLQAGGTSLSLDFGNLAKGIYYLELKGTTVNEHRQFSKQ